MSSGFLLQYMSFQKFFYLFVYSVAFYEDFYLENILAIHTLLPDWMDMCPVCNVWDYMSEFYYGKGWGGFRDSPLHYQIGIWNEIK